MEKIVIVAGDRKNPQAHHIKLAGKVSVGRAFYCDVILSDDYAEPVQLVFDIVTTENMTEGESIRRTVEVMSSTNPVLRNDEPVSAGVYDFVSGDEWSFGKTQLSAFAENHAPEPTEKIALKEYHGKIGKQLLIFFAGLVSLISYIALSNWLKNYNVIDNMEKTFANTISDGLIIMVILWVVSWGIIGRAVTGRYQFNIHFVAACAYVIVEGLFRSTFYEYPSYALNLGHTADTVLNHLVTGVCFYIFIYITLSYALNIKRLLLTCMIATTLLSAYMYFDDVRSTKPLEPHFNSAVKPPFAIMVKPESLESFRSTMDKVFMEAIEN